MTTSLQPEADKLCHQYTHLTGREARVQVYEYSLFAFFQAGFTCDEFVLVLNFLLRENKRNRFQYSIKLGHLIQDLSRFMDLLGEAKAVERNRPPKPTPRDIVLSDFRRVTPEPEGKFVPIKDVINGLREAAL